MNSLQQQKLCQNDDYVNYNKYIGNGTHGYVYERQGYPELAIKIFSNENGLCIDINENEYGIHEYVSTKLELELQEHFQTYVDIIHSPKVYGFKYLPNAYDARCCSYEMERIFSLPKFDRLIQLTPSFSQDYKESMSQGCYVGLKVLFDILKSVNHSHLYSKLIYGIGLVYGILHFKLGLDANDIEFVLGKNKEGDIKMFVIDFDKVNKLPTQFPSTLRVKLTEEDYDIKSFSSSDNMYRYLASTLHLFPSLETDEFKLAIEGYKTAARSYNGLTVADKVIEYYYDYHFAD